MQEGERIKRPYNKYIAGSQIKALSKCSCAAGSNATLFLRQMNAPYPVILSLHKWTALKEIPRVEALIFDAWNSLPECYNEVKKLAFGVLTIFGSTYSCEQAFSCINIIKSKVRSQLTNKNLEACLKLKITSYEPDLTELSKNMQGQCSH